MSKQTLTKKISTLTKSEENFQKKFLKHSQDTLDQGNLLEGIDIWSGAAWSYRISSYKTRGYYFFVRPSTAGIIRMRVLFEGVDYSKKVSILENKARIFT